jgi:hypothetical protein
MATLHEEDCGRKDRSVFSNTSIDLALVPHFPERHFEPKVVELSKHQAPWSQLSADKGNNRNHPLTASGRENHYGYYHVDSSREIFGGPSFCMGE